MTKLHNGDLTMSTLQLEKFHPDAHLLLDFLLPFIDDDMLHVIAAADYGIDVELHLVPLKLLRDSRVIPVLNWHPREVLELLRWSEPDKPGWKPGIEGVRGHFLRAFACSTLLMSYKQAENNDRWLSFNETAIQLALSIRAIGEESLPASISFFAWCLEHLSPLDTERMESPFLGLALLSLAIDFPSIDDEAIIALCEWIDGTVQTLLIDKQWFATRRKNWLLSTNHHNMKNGRWVEMGQELEGWAKVQPASEKATWVELIGNRLADT